MSLTLSAIVASSVVVKTSVLSSSATSAWSRHEKRCFWVELYDNDEEDEDEEEEEEFTARVVRSHGDGELSLTMGERLS